MNANAGSAAPAASRLLQAATHSSSTFQAAASPPPQPVFTYDLNPPPAQPSAPIYVGSEYASHATAEVMAAGPPDETMQHSPPSLSYPPPRSGGGEDANRPSSRVSGRGVWNPNPVAVPVSLAEGENHQNERLAPASLQVSGPNVTPPSYNDSLLQPVPPGDPQQQQPPAGSAGPKNKKQSKEEKKREKEMKKREKEAQKAAKKGIFFLYCTFAQQFDILQSTLRLTDTHAFIVSFSFRFPPVHFSKISAFTVRNTEQLV